VLQFTNSCHDKTYIDEWWVRNSERCEAFMFVKNFVCATLGGNEDNITLKTHAKGFVNDYVLLTHVNN